MIALSSLGQSKEVYQAAFSDKSNFSSVLRFINKNMPSKILILSKTFEWYTECFWLDEISGKRVQDLKDTLEYIMRDDRHPYNVTYFFKDTFLNRLIPDTSKYILSKVCDTMKPSRIILNSKTYQTINTSKNIVGFYTETTQPVFSSDSLFAFIVIHYRYKAGLVVENKYDIKDYDAIGKVSLVFSKQPDGKWLRIWRRFVFY